MKKIIISTIFMILSVFISSIVFADDDNFKIEPNMNNGKKWRVGYYEGGPYSDYTETMRTLIAGLIELKWIHEARPPDISCCQRARLGSFCATRSPVCASTHSAARTTRSAAPSSTTTATTTSRPPRAARLLRRKRSGRSAAFARRQDHVRPAGPRSAFRSSHRTT